MPCFGHFLPHFRPAGLYQVHSHIGTVCFFFSPINKAPFALSRFLRDIFRKRRQVQKPMGNTIVTTSITDRKKNLSELFPAILDRIITGKYSKRINLIVIRAHYRNHLAVHRSHDTRTEIPWTKSCNELPDDNSPTINSVIFDRNITGENSQRINLVMISVTIVKFHGGLGCSFISLQLRDHSFCSRKKNQFYRFVNFAITRLTACILKDYLPLTSQPIKGRTLSQPPNFPWRQQ